MIEREFLRDDYEIHTIWQTHPEDGIAEPALNLRDYSDDIVAIRQGKDKILINKESLGELIKVLRHYHTKGAAK